MNYTNLVNKRKRNRIFFKDPLLILLILSCILTACGSNKGDIGDDRQVETETTAMDERIESTFQNDTDSSSQSTELKYEDIGDIDGNGQIERVIYSSDDGTTYNKLTFVFNGENIYEHEDLLTVEIGDTVEYQDIDRDGENEIILELYPWVNSMPLVEYAVLKKVEGTWTKLETYLGEDILDNTFPISVTKGNGKFEAIISCAGYDGSVSFDAEPIYNYWKDSPESNSSLSDEITSFYENDFVTTEIGNECGGSLAWGIWDIEMSEYDNHPCIVAMQAIAGRDKYDLWGYLYISFDYDSAGKIRILNLDFKMDEEYLGY
jgi:hypothetical protein